MIEPGTYRVNLDGSTRDLFHTWWRRHQSQVRVESSVEPDPEQDAATVEFSASASLPWIAGLPEPERLVGAPAPTADQLSAVLGTGVYRVTLDGRHGDQFFAWWRSHQDQVRVESVESTGAQWKAIAFSVRGTVPWPGALGRAVRLAGPPMAPAEPVTSRGTSGGLGVLAAAAAAAGVLWLWGRS